MDIATRLDWLGTRMQELNSNTGTYRRFTKATSPFGTPTISGLSGNELRTFDLSTASVPDTVHFVATVAQDWFDGTYDGSNYTVTNDDDLTTVAWGDMSWQACWRMITAMVRANTGTTLDLSSFSITGSPVAVTAYNCDNYTLGDVRGLIAALLDLTLDEVTITNFTPEKLDVSELAIYGLTLITEKAQDIVFDSSDLSTLTPSVPIKGDRFVWGSQTYEVMSLGDELFNYTTSSRKRIRVHMKQVA